jgi:hypothetical protein
LQGFLLQVEVSQIIVHEADEPNAVIDLLDAEFLTGQNDGDVDPLSMQARLWAYRVTLSSGWRGYAHDASGIPV